MDFRSLKLDERLLARAAKMGFSQPTPIQAKAIPAVLGPAVFTGLAQTGTGKTAAFVLPLLHKIAQRKNRTGISALIITPTRELAEQIEEVTRSFGNAVGVKSMAIFGGVNMAGQVKRLKGKVDIVIACPGRLLDHINRRTIRLNQIDALVLDEADQMLDMGFFPDIKKIVARLDENRQTILFSATMPAEIEKLARLIQKKPVKIQVDKRNVNKQVSHSLFHVSQDRKRDLLLNIMETEQSYSTLVFARTKHRVRRLAKQLKQAGVNSAELHGNLSIGQRRRAMEGFKKGKIAVLVATDVAARGVDISGISHVVNFDVPVTPEVYIHRLGRTGRAAEKGVAYTFASQDEMAVVRRIEKVLKKKLPVRKHHLAAKAG